MKFPSFTLYFSLILPFRLRLLHFAISSPHHFAFSHKLQCKLPTPIVQTTPSFMYLFLNLALKMKFQKFWNSCLHLKLICAFCILIQNYVSTKFHPFILIIWNFWRKKNIIFFNLLVFNIMAFKRNSAQINILLNSFLFLFFTQNNLFKV